MGVPVPTDVKHRPGLNPRPPLNDTDPICGAIDLFSEFVNGTPDQIFETVSAEPAGGSDILHYNGGYMSQEEGGGGRILFPRIWVTNAGRPVPAGGVARITDPTGANAGTDMRIAGFSGGVPAVDVITIALGQVSGVVPFDLNSRYYWETVGGVPLVGADPTDNLTLDFGLTHAAVIRAPGVLCPGDGANNGGSIFRLNFASFFNQTMADNGGRLNPPTNVVGAFSDAYINNIQDNSLSLGASFDDGDFRGWCLEKHILAGVQAPENDLKHLVFLSGFPVA